MMNLAQSNLPELQQQFFYPSVYFPDADEGSVVDMLQDRANQNEKILDAMHKTEFDPDTEMIDPEYNHEDMIVDDEGPDGPVVRDEYEIVQPLENEPEVTSVHVNGWGVHYDVEDHEIAPKVGKETFDGEWGTETVTTSIVGDDGSVISKAAKKPQQPKKKPAAVVKKVTKEDMAKKSAEVVAAAKKTAAAVRKINAHKKQQHAKHGKKPKTLHAKVVKKIVRKRGVAKGSEHISAAKAAIRDKFRVVKAKKHNKKGAAKKPVKLASHKKTLSKVQLKKVGAAAAKAKVVKKKAVVKRSKASSIKRAIQKKYKTIKVTKKGKH